MRLHLICLTILMLVLNACGEDKQQSPTQSAPTPIEIPPKPAAAETPTVAPSQPATKETATLAQPQDAISAQVEETSTESTDEPNNKGLELAKKSGCLACHAIDKKAVGPAWKDVAKRYASDSNAKVKLVDKVAKGGRGNWTDVVGNMAMPPYSPRVSAEDIEALVDFVLALHSD